MTKTEYLNQLRKYLKRLPKADYENAMEHFTEYFEDVGAEKEQKIMEELGTPKEAAAELLKNLLREDLKDTKGEEKKKELYFEEQGNMLDFTKKTTGSIRRKVWISCLAIMAAPIALPLALTAVACLLVIGLCLCCVLLMIGALSLSTVLISAKLLLRGLVAIPYSISGAGAIIGMGILGAGLGILFWILAIFFYQWTKKVYLYFIQKIAERKVRSYE